MVAAPVLAAWWLVNSNAHVRGRISAEVWAQAHLAIQTASGENDMGKHHLTDEDTVPAPMQRSGKHGGVGADAVTVPDLMGRAVQAGDPLRLNWPGEYLDEAGLVRSYAGTNDSTIRYDPAEPRHARVLDAEPVI